MFIFSRCHSNSAAMTPVKYEVDWTDLRDTFVKWKITLIEKLADLALVTPTPALEGLM